MPLKHGKKNYWRNVETEIRHGKPRKQAEAIAYSVMDRKRSKRHK